ncbi:MAG: gamma-glutamyl-gamma-aminobutyrate hydrolase family protein [Phycisphaerales bacterium]|nr:gamma-glutamyl-gamma-aminobutyrate hydrolase family protein [Phycisphaerales bacterium]
MHDSAHDGSARPVVGITCDVTDDKLDVRRTYGRAVVRAGGVPVYLDPSVALIPAYLRLCDGFVLTGGDDPSMESFGEATHAMATPIHADRQSFEMALIAAAEDDDRAVLGVCLGMQLMGLHGRGTLDQFLPDVLPTAHEHWNRVTHTIEGSLGSGVVHSHHRQALRDAGRLEVVARAHDGVIEAIRDPARTWWVGVQWHPERTDDAQLGQGLFDALVRAMTMPVGA